MRKTLHYQQRRQTVEHPPPPYDATVPNYKPKRSLNILLNETFTHKL